uniref:Uncharacterized protein n=1 Tax=Scleropages formosus TaxID=113540 RepID=A0A8C9RKC1_SCLFO
MITSVRYKNYVYAVKVEKFLILCSIYTLCHVHACQGMTGLTSSHNHLSLSHYVTWPHPGVGSWDRKNNPEPWNKLSPTYQYKLVAVSTDYKSLKKEGPDF